MKAGRRRDLVPATFPRDDTDGSRAGRTPPSFGIP